MDFAPTDHRGCAPGVGGCVHSFLIYQRQLSDANRSGCILDLVAVEVPLSSVGVALPHERHLLWWPRLTMWFGSYSGKSAKSLFLQL